MDNRSIKQHEQAPADKRAQSSGLSRRASCAHWVMTLDVATPGPASPRPCDDVCVADDDASLFLDDLGSCSNYLTTSRSSSSFLSGAFANNSSSGAYGNNSGAFGHSRGAAYHSSSSAFSKRTAASASWGSLPSAAVGAPADAACGMSRLSSLENALDALTAVVTRQKAGGVGAGGGHSSKVRRSLDVLLDEAGSPGTVAAWWACPVIDSTPEEDVVFEDLDQA